MTATRIASEVDGRHAAQVAGFALVQRIFGLVAPDDREVNSTVTQNPVGADPAWCILVPPTLDSRKFAATNG